MVQIRAAESPHEEIVGQRVLLRPLPHRQARAVVVAHRQRAGVARGDESIVAAAVDLLLIAVELVNEIASGGRKGQVDRRRVDPIGPVGQIAWERRIGILALPHRRQRCERPSVPVHLGILCRRRVGDAVRAGKQTVQIVEAAILGVDDEDMLDPVEPRFGRRRRRQHASAERDQCGREADPSFRRQVHECLGGD